MNKLIYTLLIALQVTAFQTNAEEFHSPRTAALGGAGHAAPLLNDAIYLNPSYIALIPTYSFSSTYLSHRDADGGSGRILNFSLQDGRNKALKGGAAYTAKDKQKTINLATAYRLGDAISVGAGYKYLWTELESGAHEISASSSFVLSDEFQLSLILHNAIQTDYGRENGLLRSIIIGSKVNLKDILIFYIDPHFIPSVSSGYKRGYNIAIELVLLKDVFFRSGIFKNAPVPFMANALGEGQGLGIGWVGGRTSLDYAYKKVNRTSTLRSGFSHSLGLTLYF